MAHDLFLRDLPVLADPDAYNHYIVFSKARCGDTGTDVSPGGGANKTKWKW